MDGRLHPAKLRASPHRCVSRLLPCPQLCVPPLLCSRTAPSCGRGYTPDIQALHFDVHLADGMIESWPMDTHLFSLLDGLPLFGPGRFVSSTTIAAEQGVQLLGGGGARSGSNALWRGLRQGLLAWASNNVKRLRPQNFDCAKVYFVYYRACAGVSGL